MDMNAKYRVCVVTGTRAEYGLLRSCLFLLQARPDVELLLAVTGTHLLASFGNTQKEIAQDGFSYIPVPIPMEDDSKAGIAVTTGVALERFAELFRDNNPNILLILGDRFEIFAAAAAAHLMGISIAHISGGDVTQGAVDDAIRHSITKMSTLHFPGCADSARRIIQMGEQPETVFNVGEPGIDNCLRLPKLSRQALVDDLHFPQLLGDYSLVTFHPVTMETNTAEGQVRELIRAMDAMDGMSYVITMANADAGGRLINDIWMDEGKKRPNWLVVSSLGVQRYLSAVSYARLVIGNSSSGIYEAPALGTPTINIGDRQKGRMMADSVLCVPPEAAAIFSAMEKALTPQFLQIARSAPSPFGDGSASQQIVSILMRYLTRNPGCVEKTFYDIDFSL